MERCRRALRDPSAVSTDGLRATVVLRREAKRRLHVISGDGAELQPIGESIDVRGAASWSPDGKWVVTGGNDSQGPGLFKIPLDGGEPVRIVSKPAFNPVWSPDGELIVYAGPLSALWAPMLAVRPDGTPVELPEILLRTEGERYRFIPERNALVYMQGSN